MEMSREMEGVFIVNTRRTVWSSAATAAVVLRERKSSNSIATLAGADGF
jgi:hypothetical protein